MDMEELLCTLCEYAMDADAQRLQEHRKASETAQTYYDRLQELLGDREEADKLWSAAADIEATKELRVFRAGLSMGLRLMAMGI